MRTQQLFLLFFACLISTSVFGQNSSDKAEALTKSAIKLMDLGEYERSIKQLTQARELDPTNYVYDYEIGYALFLQQKYEETIAHFEEVTGRLDTLHPQIFQLWGNTLDINGDPNGAIEVYDQGLELFPDDGRLYLEKGVVLGMALDHPGDALASWEAGIKADPRYPSNYFWASKILILNDIKTWGLMYGEIFLNLERNTRRTAEISQLLFDTYSNSIEIKSKKKINTNFGGDVTIQMDQNGNFSAPSDFRVNTLLSISAGTLVATNPRKIKQLDAGHLHHIRDHFLTLWFTDDGEGEESESFVLFGEKQDFVLFDWHQELRNADLFEIYTYWVFRTADPQSYQTWREENEIGFNIFAEWMNSHSFPVNKENVMSRIPD